MRVNQDGVVPAATFHGAHSEVIRTFNWDWKVYQKCLSCKSWNYRLFLSIPTPLSLVEKMRACLCGRLLTRFNIGFQVVQGKDYNFVCQLDAVAAASAVRPVHFSADFCGSTTLNITLIGSGERQRTCTCKAILTSEKFQNLYQFMSKLNME